MNHMQKEKQKTMTTTTTTTRITKLSVGLLASVIALSSISAAQLLLVTNNNVAFAEEKCTETETEESFEVVCIGGGTINSDFDEIQGGRGGYSTCTLDFTTGTQTCSNSGGGGSGGSEVSSGGSGGRKTLCTAENEVEVCSTDVGGGGGTPKP
jgi:hypothetical protein